MEQLQDVVAVNIDSGRVRILAKAKAMPDAEAIVNMAVVRRGVEEEFYSDAPAGKYADGDKWEGR